MKISNKGIEFIKQWEGLKLVAYQDIGDIWTIGVGHTKDVSPGMTITMAQAEEFLRQDVAEFEEAIAHLIKVPLNQNQYDALISFSFNLGVGALTKSTLLKLLNKGDYTGAANEFIKWCRANGKIVEGLMRRRAAEKRLFIS